MMQWIYRATSCTILYPPGEDICRTAASAMCHRQLQRYAWTHAVCGTPINTCWRYQNLELQTHTHTHTHIIELDSLRWFSQRRSPTPHLGVHTQGATTPHSNSAENFVQCTYPQVSSSYVYSLGIYRANKQTNKHTNRRRWKHPMLFAMLRRWIKITPWALLSDGWRCISYAAARRQCMGQPYSRKGRPNPPFWGQSPSPPSSILPFTSLSFLFVSSPSPVQCDFCFDLFFSFSFVPVLSNLLTKTCWWSA